MWRLKSILSQVNNLVYNLVHADHIVCDVPAFEGFNIVPSLHPLETLHNKLTMKELDDFLTRATTSKFVTPISSPPYSNTPLASPHVPVTRAPRGIPL